MHLIQRLRQCAQDYPDRVAVQFGTDKWSYRALDARSNQIANALAQKGISKNDVVAITLPRSFDLVASLIGVLKSGAAYLPLDESYPADRIQYMLEKSGAKFKIDQSFADSALDASTTTKEVLGDIGYIIFTSGSTGLPKGVSMGLAALTNLIEWQNTQNIESKVTLQFTPVSFDVHFQEIFSTLSAGGTLVLISDEARKNPAELLKVLTDSNVDRLFLPYVALNQIAEVAVQLSLYPKSLKDVTTAGEQLKITSSIRKLFKNIEAKLHNHYGPSETHVVTALTLESESDKWAALPTIGFALPNCSTHIIEGELYLGGICLANGYVNDEKQTLEKFIQHPQFGRLYRTGDMAEFVNGTNEIKYLGRSDGQIKIRGYRVEVSEVEAILAGIGTFAAVKAFEDQGINELCAFVVGDTTGLHEKLQTIMPIYMIPKKIVSVASLPLTPSGKVNYKALEVPAQTSRPNLAEDFVAPASMEEKALANLFEKYLNVAPVGINDSFFLLGGNSLLAIKLVNEANKVLNQNWSPMRLFDRPSVAQFLTEEREQVQSIRQYGGPIAIVAMTGRFPGAKSVKELWDKITKQESLLEKFDLSEVSTSIPSEVLNDENFVNVVGRYPGEKEFDASLFGISPREAELMDPQQRKFLELSYEALETAAITPGVKQNIGVFAGMGNSNYGEKLRSHSDKVKSFGEFNVMLGNEKDYIATRIAHKLNLTGPAISVHTGCSTSLVAIIQAVNSLRLGQCDVALAGGVSVSGSEPRGHLFQEGGILSRDGLCRPFDMDATGTIFSDGAGIIVLKRVEDAEADGDNILAVIKGVGINNDGADKMSFTAPSRQGQLQAILSAQRDAGITSDQVGYVEAHGTATPVGDPIEVAALAEAFSRNRKNKSTCVVSSLKSNVGHLTSAAGVAGVIKAVMALKENLIPGNANFKSLNPAISDLKTDFVFSSENQTFSSDSRIAAVSSFGVGGTNAHIILENYKSNNEISVNDVELLKLSAKTNDQLEGLISQVQTISTAMASALEKGRVRFKERAAVLKLGDKNVVFKGTQTQRSTTLLFTGQGSQVAHMGFELYSRNPVFKQVIDESALVLDTILDKNLKEILFGAESESLLSDTYYAQPAIFVFEYAVAKMLMAGGLVPDSLIGHSVGEYVAATLAGVFSPEDGLRIIAERARLCRMMERGAMISLATDLTFATVTSSKYSLSIAAINGPRSIVLAGNFEKIELALKGLEEAGIAAVKLATSHAFHSDLMNGVVPELKSFIEKIKLNRPSIKLISSVTGNVEDVRFMDAQYWAEQVVLPVDYVSAIKNNKLDVLIEVGAKNILATLALRINSELSAISIGQSGMSELAAFYQSIAKLWCLGIDVRLYDSVRSVAPAPTYVFNKSKYWLEDKRPVSSGVIMSDSVQTQISKIFTDASGMDITSHSVDTNFLEMGMDSLLLTQVALKLKKAFNKPITFRQLMEEFNTPALLASYIGPVAQPAQKIQVKEAVAEVIKPAEALAEMTTVAVAPTIVATSEGVQGIIEKQLALMQEQLRVLSSGKVAPVTATKSTPVVIKEEPKKVVVAASVKAKVSNAKEAFGASARITVEKTSDLSDKQQTEIKNFLSNYSLRTAGSKKFTQDNRKNHADPRVVTGFKPEWKEIVYPIVVNKSLGQKLWDVDGNEYLDMTCGFGSNFFGNGNAHIKLLMQKQIEDGMEIGPQHPLVAEVSKLINELTGNERSAFCNTGSEAVLGAMRVARTVTGREKIVVFSGSYHGINDEVILRAGKTGQSYPAAPGINGNSVSNMIVLDYGTEESLAKIAELGDEVAAVLVEPVQSRRCDFVPVEFLKKLRTLTEQNGSCLIFDEVITGFRNHPGGAQAMFGIRADLCAYGKIVGGGMPIGVISGKSSFMDALDGGHWQYGDDSTPTVGVTYFAGTFVRHPLALAAAKGALEIIKQEGVAGLKRLADRAQKFSDELNLFLQLSNVPLKMDNFGSLMKPKWKQEIVGGELLFAHLRYFGVHAYDGFPWFVNLAHTDADLAFVLNAFKKAVAAMQLLGLLPMGNVHHEVETKNVFNATQPPVDGAVLGRNELGAPAWFIPKQTGGYDLIERQ